jgi:hypothetical protein
MNRMWRSTANALEIRTASTITARRRFWSMIAKSPTKIAASRIVIPPCDKQSSIYVSERADKNGYKVCPNVIIA